MLSDPIDFNNFWQYHVSMDSDTFGLCAAIVFFQAPNIALRHD
jgi:hypothetical protein